jgi:hypothetical protein
VSALVEVLAGMATGSALTGIGIVYGRRLGRRDRQTAEPRPICTCDHPLSSHDPDTDKCHGRTNERYSDRRGGWVTDPCPCRQYVGPRPIDQVFQPRMLPPGE